ADDAVDCLPIFRLLERARRVGREMIAIAMGQAGIMTRVLGPSRGAFLTYGSLDDENATAPGQVTAKDLRQIYRIDRIDGRTEIFGIIGQPVGQRSEEHTSELQSRGHLVCRLLLEKKTITKPI